MTQILFLVLSIILLITGHALFWYIFIRLFYITTLHYQIIIAIVILGLFLSAILSSFFSRRWNNTFTRIYYIFSGLWIGLFVNFCLMLLIILLLKLLALIFVFSLPVIFLKIIFLGGALLLSIIGVYRAFFPKITEYEVKIKNLPEAWNNKVIVQLSDVHLGPVYQKKFFCSVIKKINKLNPQAVFITGDLFDGTECDFTWLNHSLVKLNASQGVYYGLGNHDLYLGFQRVKKILKGNQVNILDNRMMVVNGLQIIGISYSFDDSFSLEKEVLKQVNYDSNLPSLLLLHVPRNIKIAKKLGIDLQLSGHTHNGQLWPFNYIAKWVHRGYGYGFFEEGDFSLIVNGGVGTWGPPMRTTSRSEIVKILLKRK